MYKLIIILALFIGFSLSLSSATLNYQSSMTNTASASGAPDFGDGWESYGEVFIRCSGDRCILECQSIGSLACTWNNGFNAESIGCVGLVGPNREDVANEADVQEMTDYAIDQAELSIFSGSYNSNLIVGSTVYYRTVTWDYDSTTKILDINLNNKK